MPSLHIPPSIELLQVAATQLAAWTDSPSNTRLIQVGLLTALTMFEGVGTPAITGISPLSDGITIRWEGGSSDTLTWDQETPGMVQFAHYVNRRVLGYSDANRKQLPAQLAANLITRLQYYESALEVVERRLTHLVSADISKTFQGIIDPIFIFVLMGSLPHAQLNALFLHIQQHLPDDFQIRVNGKTVAISQVFQPNQDLRNMIEKVNVYLDLYLSKSMPVIREITQTETVKFFDRLMANPTIRSGLVQEIQSVINQQIKPRHTLYQYVIRCLKGHPQ